MRDRIADQTISSISAAISRSKKGKGREVEAPSALMQEDDSEGKMTLLERKQKLIIESRRKLMEKLLRDKASSGKEGSMVNPEVDV